MSGYHPPYAYEYDTETTTFPPFVLISIWFGVVLVMVTAATQISSRPDQPVIAPLAEGFRFVLVAFLLGSAIYLLLHAGQGVKFAALPLVVNLGTLLLIQLVPFGSLWQDIQFRAQWSRYDAVVAQIESGELTADAIGQIILPASYQQLAPVGGFVLTEEVDGVWRIFFPLRVTADGATTGYCYRSDNNPPQMGDFGGNWRLVVEKQPFWFFCQSVVYN